MRAALQCLLIALITTHIQENKADDDDDFRPTPIPLDDWNYRLAGRAGSLHQINKTDPSPTVAAVPAHYWEDALRHSVYLTLVRDKIDQLIANGAANSPDKPDYASKEVDDHDLWEKIKMAPFDRLNNEDHVTFGDVTIMARGKLMNENTGFRFAEDNASKEKCADDKCMEGVKALWSVKRMRQREPGAPPGKYHYELTFSVTSQTPRKQRPYESPVRTFTVRENPPEEPQRAYDINHKQRPQRAVWFHKNIVPTNHHYKQYNQGLDRIFSSFFSDEETYVETPRHKQQNPYVPQMYPPQLSKTGYVNGQVSVPESYNQKRLMPYNFKPPSVKYSRPPLSAPPLSHVQHHMDFESMANNPYPTAPPPPDHFRYQSSNVVKTTRPAVLPTPIMPVSTASFSHIKNSTEDFNTILNVTDKTLTEPDIITGFKSSSNPKAIPMKVSYFPEHVRPPVYNAPPGIFVTMDKKPFKPMPPLKLVHSLKPGRTKPIDFRPSPQVLDVQFSDPSGSTPLSDAAFRPITIHYTNNKTTEKSIIPDNNKKRKLSPPNTKKSQNKHENIMIQSTTTTTPDIITIDNESEEATEMEWANLLSAFSKTTPMVSQKQKMNKTENVPGTTFAPTTVKMKPTIVGITTTSETSTTVKPKKRTRPPPKFTKSEKIKKHKRITTTTTTTTEAPEKEQNQVQDLTPQASSAATSRPSWKPKNKITSTTPLTSSSSTFTTTSKPSSTTTEKSTTIVSIVSSTTKDIEPATTQPKNKNRYRQSTLMLKGTSVKHDRWSQSGVEKNKTSTSSKYPPRRKGSNFQGYVFPKRKITETEHTKEEHPDDITNDISKQIVNNTMKANEVQSTTPQDTETSLVYTSEKNELQKGTLKENTSNVEEDDFDDEDNESGEETNDQDTKDHTEYIFNVTATPPVDNKYNIDEEDKLTTTEQIVTSSPYSVTKNKTKCKKKKKQQNLTTTEGVLLATYIDKQPTTSTTTSTTENTSTTESFVDFFEEFIVNDKPKRANEKSIVSNTPEPYEVEESGSHDIFVHPNDEFQRFMDSLEKDDEEYDNDDDNDYSPFNNVEENSEARTSNSDYADYQDRSYGTYEFLPVK